MIAGLKPDAYESAEQLASNPPTTDPSIAGIQRWSIFLSPTEVAFVFEGEDVEQHTREWFNDPVLSAAISHWLPLFDGPLHAAREAHAWEQGAPVK